MHKNDGILLQEGVWSKTKHVLSKLGSLEKGGKIIGRNKQAKAAIEQVNKLLEKQSSALVGQLHKQVKENFKGFPNMEHHEDFLKAVNNYAIFYDSIVAATKIDPSESTYLHPSIVNELIKDERVVVKHVLDYELSSVYKVMKEDDGPINRDDTKSTSIDTLKSNKLPLILMGVGAGMGAFGWLLQQKPVIDFIVDAFSTKKDIVSVLSKNEVFAKIGNGEGITQTIMRVRPDVDLTPNAPMSNFVSWLKEQGGGSVEKGLQSIGQTLKDPTKIKEMKELMEANPNQTMGELYDQAKGSMSSGKGGSWFETVPGASIKKKVITTIVKTVTKKAVGAGVAAAGLGSLLVPLGITVMGAGIAVKLLRMKGLKSSRAQVLNDLLQTLQLVELSPETGIQPATAQQLALPSGEKEEKKQLALGTGEEKEKEQLALGAGEEEKKQLALGAGEEASPEQEDEQEETVDIDYEDLTPFKRGEKSKEELAKVKTGVQKLLSQHADENPNDKKVKLLQAKLEDVENEIESKENEEEQTGRLTAGNEELSENLVAFEKTLAPNKVKNKAAIEKDIALLKKARTEIGQKIMANVQQDLLDVINSDPTKSISGLNKVYNYSLNLKRKYSTLLKGQPYGLGDSATTLARDLKESARRTQQNGGALNEEQAEIDFFTNVNVNTPLEVKKDGTLKQVAKTFAKKVKAEGYKMKPADLELIEKKIFNAGSGVGDIILAEIDSWMRIRIKNYEDYLATGTLNESIRRLIKKLIAEQLNNRKK
jgi:hypothetical protein